MKSRLESLCVYGMIIMLAVTSFAQDSLNVSRVGLIDTPGNAWGVAVMGNYAYIADGESGLRVVDISNPTAPMEVGFYTTSESPVIWKVAVEGNYAYLADYYRGMRVIDITNPAAPTEVGFHGTGYAQGLAVEGNYAYVADYQRGMHVIDIANPASPVEVGLYSPPQGAVCLAVSGNYAYVADNDRGLHVVDIIDPTAPTEAGFINMPESASGVAVAGNYACVADGWMGLRVIDITNPVAPVEIGFCGTPFFANGVAVEGNLAYVADCYSLRVIDITYPATPTVVGFYDIPSCGWYVALSGNYAYTAQTDRGLSIYNVSYFTSGLRLQSPNGGESLQISSSEIIRWVCLDSMITSVRIELNRNYSVAEWEVLVNTTENDGEWTWLITEPPSNDCRIRVSAIGDTLVDVSDENFSIVSTQGYLGVVISSTPNSLVTSWDFGDLECPTSGFQPFRIRNVGTEPIVVFQTLEPTSDEFSLDSSCGNSLVLAPGDISACSLTVSFAPTSEGLINDTLRIQTDAVNGIGGFVRIPLSGCQIRTPAAPEIVISAVGNDARLRWSPINESIGHCDIPHPRYLVFFSEDPDGPFWFHGGTNATTYFHEWAFQEAPSMFYQVVAVEADPGLLQMLPDGGLESRVSEEEVLRLVGKWPIRHLTD